LIVNYNDSPILNAGALGGVVVGSSVAPQPLTVNGNVAISNSTNTATLTLNGQPIVSSTNYWTQTDTYITTISGIDKITAPACTVSELYVLNAAQTGALVVQTSSTSASCKIGGAGYPCGTSISGNVEIGSDIDNYTLTLNGVLIGAYWELQEDSYVVLNSTSSAMFAPDITATNSLTVALGGDENVFNVAPGVITCGEDMEIWGNVAIGTTGTTYTLKLNGQPIITTASQTITHATNFLNYDPSQIGTFCETTGELADVYGADYQATLARPCDAIVKVKQSTTLNSAVLGVIVGPDTFASHGDVLCLIIDGEYEIGQILVPDSSGLCRKATEQQMPYAAMYRIALPKITAIFPGKEYVAAFM
jgi:hypothetical protein